ncbi:hypothetical protein BU15DRAFT_60028 [Melanogaster broomeanus]|nr:hypothetical protein BU15DRAFT_60028 [Melanogaster broomeanus]
MTRVPISFYLNIIAACLVVFNHYASSETGDVALNKVTGAAGRFYALFQGTARAFQGGCGSRLEAELCSSIGQLTSNNLLPCDVAGYTQTQYGIQPSVCYSESSVGMSGSQSRLSRSEYEGSDVAFAYQPYMRPPKVVPLESNSLAIEEPVTQLPVAFGHSGQPSSAFSTHCRDALRPAQAIGTIPSPFASWYLLQVYVVVVADLLRWVKWETWPHLSDIGARLAELAYISMTRTGERVPEST